MKNNTMSANLTFINSISLFFLQIEEVRETVDCVATMNTVAKCHAGNCAKLAEEHFRFLQTQVCFSILSVFNTFQPGRKNNGNWQKLAVISYRINCIPTCYFSCRSRFKLHNKSKFYTCRWVKKMSSQDFDQPWTLTFFFNTLNLMYVRLSPSL